MTSCKGTAKVFDGSWGLITASDEVYAGYLDGVWKRPLRYKIEGEDLFKCKIQAWGDSRYIYSERLEDIFSGSALLFLNHTRSVKKEESIAEGVRERSLTIVIPVTDESVGGCSRDDPAVDRAARVLQQGFYHQRCEPPAAGLHRVDSFFDGRCPPSVKDKLSRAKLDELTSLLLGVFFEQYEPARSYALTSREMRRAQEARDIIMNDLSATPRLNHLGRTIGLNRMNLNRAFREVFGTTVFQFLFEERMKLALTLLKKNDQSGADIAASVGYEHYSNFSTAFKRYYKFSPSEVSRQ